MIHTILEAKILFGEDYDKHLNDMERRAIIHNDLDCRVSADEEIEADDNAYLGEDNV